MERREIEFHRKIFNEAYMDYLRNTSRYLLLYGGAGSGKSVFAAQKLVIRMLAEEGHRFLLIRKVGKTIKNSQYRLIKDLVYQYKLDDLFSFSDYNSSITCANNNEIISTGTDDVEKLKSIHGITGIWIEEATELRRNDFLQIDLRLRGETQNYKQIILSFNPIDRLHWIKEMFFDNENAEASILKTTFRDNKFIDAQYLKILESLSMNNKDFHQVYALGEWGASSNIIYPVWEIYSADEKIEGVKVFGLDFGFNNPTAIVECRISGAKAYIRERLYEKGLTNADLINKLKNIINNKSDFIFADSAEPQRIEEIYRAGFNIFPADKNVKNGIDYLKRFKIKICGDSENLINELNAYKWAEDKNGNTLDEAIKENDHLLDAARYCIYTYGKKYLADYDIVLPEKRRVIQKMSFVGY